MFLEALTFEDDEKDASHGGTMDYQVLLDHRLSKADTTVNATTITCPAGYVVTAATRLVDENGNISGVSATTGSNVFTYTMAADTNFFIGVPYTMEYTFSQPFLKSDKATETGRYQLQRAYLEYANARSFTVDVTHNPKMVAPNKQTVTSAFATDALQQELISGTAELQTGFFPFAIQERNDRLQLVIKNATPYPSDFLSIDYEARAFSRGSRWRG
jgi:hypothetical protein